MAIIGKQHLTVAGVVPVSKRKNEGEQPVSDQPVSDQPVTVAAPIVFVGALENGHYDPAGTDEEVYPLAFMHAPITDAAADGTRWSELVTNSLVVGDYLYTPAYRSYALVGVSGPRACISLSNSELISLEVAHENA